jgi:uncharacterized protein YggE
MKTRFTLLAAIASLGGAAHAASPEQPGIQVAGTGVVMAVPDTFSVDATVNVRGRTAEQALAEAASTYSKLKDALPQLEGLKKLTINASEASVSTLRDPKCVDVAEDETACAIIG